MRHTARTLRLLSLPALLAAALVFMGWRLSRAFIEGVAAGRRGRSILRAEDSDAFQRAVLGDLFLFSLLTVLFGTAVLWAVRNWKTCRHR